MRYRAFLFIDPQHHGCVGIVGLQDLLPVLGVVLAQALHPPGRMVPARHGVVVGGRHQGVALAQKAAQAAVDERGLRARGRVVLGRLHRLVHQGKGFVGRGLWVPAQRQRAAQQGIGGGCGGAGGQLSAQGLGTPGLAQDLEQQGLHAGAQSSIHRRQRCCARLPATDCLQGACHCREQPPQGHRSAPRRRRWTRPLHRRTRLRRWH